jgi:hypothetical protein
MGQNTSTEKGSPVVRLAEREGRPLMRAIAGSKPPQIASLPASGYTVQVLIILGDGIHQAVPQPTFLTRSMDYSATTISSRGALRIFCATIGAASVNIGEPGRSSRKSCLHVSQRDHALGSEVMGLRGGVASRDAAGVLFCMRETGSVRNIEI